MLLTDAIAAYVAERADCGEVSPDTARQLAWRLAGVARACPGLEVGDLTRGHVVDWQRTIGTWRAATRRGHLSTLKVFCAWAVEGGLLGADPTVRLARVRDEPPTPRPELFEPSNCLICATASSTLLS